MTTKQKNSDIADKALVVVTKMGDLDIMGREVQQISFATTDGFSIKYIVRAGKQGREATLVITNRGSSFTRNENSDGTVAYKGTVSKDLESELNRWFNEAKNGVRRRH